MSERGRILLLSMAILVIVSVLAATLAIAALYQMTFEQHRDRLVRMVLHRAGILKTVTAFDAEVHEGEIGGVAGATEVSRLIEVYKHFATFGDTGEFALARLAGDQIVWLLRSRQDDATQLSSTIFDSQAGQPMQRALNGESGTMVGLDYRGKRVLAAYEPVPELGWGAVAKIDIAEIREPFVHAEGIAAGITLILVAAGVGLNLRLTLPLVQRIEARVAQRTAELSEANQSLQKEISERKRLEEELRAAASEATMAEERERRKLAVDLHDGVGQLLGLASMKLGALRTSIESFGLAPEVRELEQIVIEVQRCSSSLVFQLSPPTLHDVGLVAAAHSLAEDMQRRFGLHVTVEENGERQLLDEATRTTLFRALSELLVNVAKHAETGDADIRFAWQDRLVEITIEDDGAGFDPSAATSGYGLFSIRERLTRLGGSAEIESSPGKGTRTVLAAPIAAAEEERDTGSA